MISDMPKTNTAVTKTTRFLRLIVTSFCLVALVIGPAQARPNPQRSAGNPRYSAIIMDAQTGRVLHQSGADTPRYPASLTKMMTLFLVFEALDRGRIHLNKQLTVSRHAMDQPPSKLGIRPDRSITIHQAILALVTRSANDVAMAVAETVGGSERNFARMMTERARSLGMKNTTFLNPSGLPNPGQRTTARDMATLSRALMQYFPHYYHYFATKSFTYRGQIITTHNNLIRRFSGMDGLKTGFINASGFNLAASAVRNNRRVIVVVFGGRSAVSRDNHVAELMNRGFAMLAREKQPVQVATLSAPSKQVPPIVGAPAAITNAAATSYAPPVQQTGVTTMTSTPAAPSVTTASIGSGTGNWGIQVGAYASAALGQKALQMARGILGDLPPQATGVVMPAQTPQGVLFRARFLGLSAQSASKACQRLRECMIFAMQ